jgi:hypothetical protein
MPTTAYGFTYPAGAAANDVPADLKTALDSVGPYSNMRFASAAARDALLTSPVEGMEAYLADTNIKTWYDGATGAWVPRYALTQIASAGSSADLTVSTTITDIASATVTFTTTKINALWVATCQFDMHATATSAGDSIRGYLAVDGTNQGGVALLTMDTVGRATTAGVWTGTLAATGSHTLKLRGDKTTAGGTSQIRTSTTKLVVQVYEQ